MYIRNETETETKIWTACKEADKRNDGSYRVAVGHRKLTLITEEQAEQIFREYAQREFTLGALQVSRSTYNELTLSLTVEPTFHVKTRLEVVFEKEDESEDKSYSSEADVKVNWSSFNGKAQYAQMTMNLHQQVIDFGMRFGQYFQERYTVEL